MIRILSPFVKKYSLKVTQGYSAKKYLLQT